MAKKNAVKPPIVAAQSGLYSAYVALIDARRDFWFHCQAEGRSDKTEALYEAMGDVADSLLKLKREIEEV